MKNVAFFQYKAFIFSFCVFLPACNGSDNVDVDDDTVTAESLNNLKSNRRSVSIYSDTTDLKLQSYVRSGKNNYTLDYEATCAIGVNCEFIVSRASVNDVTGLKLGDWRPTLAIQNVGFDGCLVTYGDFGQGPSTRGSCHVEDLEVNANVSFTW